MAVGWLRSSNPLKSGDKCNNYIYNLNSKQALNVELVKVLVIGSAHESFGVITRLPIIQHKD
jgi:hypothetical protein